MYLYVSLEILETHGKFDMETLNVKDSVSE